MQCSAKATATVFPAYAGMFRIRPFSGRYRPCFPRIRGDVPQSSWYRCAASTFSPHTRGCSVGLKESGVSAAVFPAYAGMFRPLPGLADRGMGFPRIRGDVPNTRKEVRKLK